MKRQRAEKRLFFCAVSLCLILLPCIGQAQIPHKINYQGYLSNAAGVPVNGAVQMLFSIYNVPSGGTGLWTETQNVTVTHGVYNVEFGDVTPVNLAFDVQYYLGIKVGADPEMTPRIPLTSVGYAFRAQTVETISSHTHSGADISSGTVAEARIDPLIARDSEVTAAVGAHALRTDNPHSTTSAQAGAVALNQVNSITSSMIVDGAIVDADISASAAISFSKLSGVASSTHNHDATYVNVTGDTMTGSLNLPSNGLVAGTNQLVLSGGNVGMGTSSPTQKLEVSGNVKISGTGSGLAFPDGTTQTTAVTGGGGGVPSGFMILGDTSTSPSGYTYTGKSMEASWTARANMPTARAGHVAAVVNNKIYAIGGVSATVPLATNEEYDPATDTWTTRASMLTARYGSAVGVVNNKIYAIGGCNVWPWGTSALGSNEEYDPATNSWATKTGMPTARTHLAVAAVNNKIYAIGGYNGSTFVNTNQEYDPATNTWATKANMPTARYAPGWAAVNNKIYVVGGYGGSFIGTNEEYDPAINIWTTKAIMPTVRSDVGTAVLNNRVYVIGGWKNNALFSTNEEYDPATNTWTTKAGMPTARCGPAGAVVSNKVYVIGGTQDTTGFLGISTNEEFAPQLLHVHRKN
jgi:N-acetylneuraminic acid mutarotase